MKKSFITKLFQGRLQEPISEEEQQIIDHWENENFTRIRDLPSPDEKHLHEVERRMLQNIHSKIKPPLLLKIFNGGVLLKIAAILVVVSAFSYLFFSIQVSDDLIIVRSAKGSKKFLLLPDSSKVWLNAGSAIEYSKNFGAKRELYILKGEVFFDVKHKPESPFIVMHNKVYVKVLGTAFNIKVSGVKDVRVTVTRGKVEVGTENKPYTVLTPDKEIILEKNKIQNYYTRDVDARKIANWKINEVNLYDVSFEDIIVSIQDAYNVDISYPKDEMKNSISTIHYSSAQELSQVLEMVKMIHGLNYNIKGKEVDLSTN